MEVNLTIVGQRGTILADCFGPNVYHNGAPNDRYTVQYTYFDEWIGLIDEFADCIRAGREPQVNLRWHRPTIEVMNACYESIASGQPVAIGENEVLSNMHTEATAVRSDAECARVSNEVQS